MDAAAARFDLTLLVAADVEPTLTDDELDRLVELARRVDALGHSPDSYEPWRPLIPYLAGQQVVPDPRDGRYYQVVQSGTSGTVQPVWADAPTVNTAVDVPDPSLSITGTPGSTAYAYRVAAVGTGGEGAASSEVYTTYGPATLSVGNAVAVTWTAISGATSYRVYGRTLDAPALLNTVVGPTYTDDGTDTPSGLPAAAFLDGTVAWMDAGSTTWTPTFDLYAAAAAAWRLKAAKVASHIDFTADGATFKHSQILQGCLAMASMYASASASRTVGQFELPVPNPPRRRTSTAPLDDRLDPEEFPLREAWTTAVGLTPEQVP